MDDLFNFAGEKMIKNEIAESKFSQNSHYGSKYFAYQQEVGEFAAWANSKNFQKNIGRLSNVIDFGCGGGFLLKQLNCNLSLGIEPNDSAASMARSLGIQVVSTSIDAIDAVGDCWADNIISNHALEHTLNPLQELVLLRRLLKPGGVIHFFVPCESISCNYMPLSRDRHLFTWSPMNLGNLFYEAGYEIDYVRPFIHKWPPFYRSLSRLGWPVFNILSRVYGRIDRSSFQVEIKARRPLS